VTDANLVLGILDAAAFLGGERKLDVAAAKAAIGTAVAQPLGIAVEDAASAIFRMVNDAMAEALRMRAVESNVDIRRFEMMAFGGGGGIHGAEVARRVGIRTLICPPRAGVFSAAGLLVAPTSVEALRTRVLPLTDITPAVSQEMFGALESEARAQLVDDSTYETIHAVDMSYVGQEYELTVRAPRLPRTEADWAELRAGYEAIYRARYGRILENFAVKVVTWRVRLAGPNPELLSLQRRHDDRPGLRRRIFAGNAWVEAAVLDRASIAPGERVAGPAVIQDLDTTILVPDGATARCDAAGAIVIAL
jgi:N-methylhydantoinase A/oxoprolinase/acetone carboxylase beta subunit